MCAKISPGEANPPLADAQFTPPRVRIKSANQEFESKVGCGEFSYTHASDAAQAAGVTQVLRFRHNPAHNDVFLNGMLVGAQKRFAPTNMACKGKMFVA
ncbi:MAG TPA: hypothetical protein VME23_22295 [Terracidiphilus sp.]|nr:hypothetical protein [Terracidiphilus sp.]